MVVWLYYCFAGHITCARPIRTGFHIKFGSKLKEMVSTSEAPRTIDGSRDRAIALSIGPLVFARGVQGPAASIALFRPGKRGRGGGGKMIANDDGNLVRGLTR